MTAGKVYDVGIADGSSTVHAATCYPWPWGWYQRALCGARVARMNRPFLVYGSGSCPDCSRYVNGIRAS